MQDDKLQVLKKYFGYDSFREGQEEVIDNILKGRDVLCIMPTGAGKSVCYQVPALMSEGVTIVISPLISLMKDQVQFLVGAGVRAAYVNSSLSPAVIDKVLLRIKNSQYKIIYVAPERLATYSFCDAVSGLNISEIVVDEAHCISKWGHDFRPSYVGIVKFVNSLKTRPVVSAFTATATSLVKKDICTILKLNEPYILAGSFDRPNLFFDVRQPKDKDRELINILKSKVGESGIIYCATRKTVDDVCQMLIEGGYPATKYHAGLSDEDRAKAQDDFIYDRKPIMVATNAFGMGIDKGNVSFVLHYNMPKDMESYYQEAGRAGRDGNRAECILLFSEGDIYTNKFLIEHSKTENTNVKNEYRLLNIMVDYCKTDGCLRQYILGYFGEEHQGNCSNCGNCVEGKFEVLSVTEEAKKVYNCILHLPRMYGASLVTAILHGGKDKRIVEGKLFKVEEYGSLKNFSRKEISAIIDKMLKVGLLEQEGYEYPVLKAGSNSLDNFPEISINIRKGESKVKSAQSRVTNIPEDLLSRLKDLRAKIARSEGVPAYIVFSDATLRDMCIKLPKNLSEFLSVSGVGDIKCSRYGSAFVEEIQRYIAKI
jgi:ATP-dependent DNA helicase RecQ